MRVPILKRSLMVMAVMFWEVMATVPAYATILTFDVGALGNNGQVPLIYGDNVTSTTDMANGFSYGMGNGFTPNITVDYATRAISTGDIAVHTLTFTFAVPPVFGDLINVAAPYINGDAFGEVILTPGAGSAVKLNSFDLAGFEMDRPNQSLLIFDNLGPLQQFTNLIVEGSDPSGNPTHSPFSFTNLISRSGPLRIQFGIDTSTVGIDNINFDQVAVVPIPSAMLLFGSGIAGLTALGRLKKRMTA